MLNQLTERFNILVFFPQSQNLVELFSYSKEILNLIFLVITQYIYFLISETKYLKELRPLPPSSPVTICFSEISYCDFYCLLFIEQKWEMNLIKTHKPPEEFSKQRVLKNFTKFTGKHLCLSPFFDNVAGLRQLYQLFSSKFWKVLKAYFLHNTSGWLLLNMIIISNNTGVISFSH